MNHVMPPRRLRPSLLALALASGAVATPILAQDKTQGTGGGDETIVVVKGYRQAVQSAVATKRKSDIIVDVIKADDMASFPDANLAESIQRVPGVSITRDGGEGREVTVRGLGGDFVRTTLNGVDAYSATTGSTLGVVAGINRTRGFDFSTFASELFNSVSVAKSQSAEMEEGSLGSNIDLQTGRPFDKPGFRAAFSAQAAYYDINKTTSPRIAGLISDTWDTGAGRFGALFSIAYSTRKETEDGYSDTSQSDYSDANQGFCAPPGTTYPVNYVNPLSGSGPRSKTNICFSQVANPAIGSDPAAWAKINVPNVFLPRNPGLGRFQLDQKRLGMTTSLQWRPDEGTHVTFDGVFSQFDQNRLDYALSLASNNRNLNGASLQYPLFDGRPDTSIMDVDVQSTGQVDYMKLNNVDIKHIEEQSVTTTKTYQLDLDLDQKLNDKWSYNVKFGYAGSDYRQPWDVLMSYDAFNKNGYVWDSRGSARQPYINYGYDVTDPNNLTFANTGTGLTPDIRITRAAVYNDVASFEGNTRYDFSNALAFKAGIMMKTYDFKTTQQQRLFPNNGNPCTVSSSSSAALAGSSPTSCNGGYQTFNFAKFASDFPGSAPLSAEVTGFGKTLGLPAGSVTGWVVPDVSAYIGKLGLLCNCANSYGDFRLSYTTALGSNRTVKEEDTAAYTQMDFDTTVLGGRRLRGNLGVRYVETDLTATGFTSATSQVTAEHKYSDLLPSFNAALDIRDDLVARVAFSKVMARPTLGDLSPGGSVNATFGAETATIGNPYLNPFRAKNYDLSLEWYPQKGAIVSVAVFYKDVGSNIQQFTVIEPFTATGLPSSLLVAPSQPTDNFTVTTYLNTAGGYVKGLELNWQQPFTFLPGAWKNLGALFNYTYVDSRETYYLTTGTTPLVAHNQFPNVSKNSVNATLYYDDGRFQTHLSVAYRSKYIVALPFKAGLNDAFGSYPTTNVDLSASYQLTPHFKLNFDALNLTDQAADQWSGETRLSQRVYSKTGRQFFLGGMYSF
jgi:TonB-dependent receptor